MALEKQGTMIQALIAFYFPDRTDHLLKYFPEIQKGSLGARTPGNQAVEFLPTAAEVLSLIHSSWLIPLLKRYPAPLQTLLVSILPSETRSLITQQLTLTHPSLTSPADALHPFFLQMLCQQLGVTQLLPLHLLPVSPLNGLLSLPYTVLEQTIPLLGLQDLAIAIRTVINKQLLEKVSKILSKSQEQFLKLCLQRKAVTLLPKIDLAKWDGQSASLMSIVSQRGWTRLGIAAATLSPSALWYLSRHLEQTRGLHLETLAKKEHASAAPQLVHEVEFLLRSLRPTDIGAQK